MADTETTRSTTDDESPERTPLETIGDDIETISARISSIAGLLSYMAMAEGEDTDLSCVFFAAENSIKHEEHALDSVLVAIRDLSKAAS